MLELGDFLLQGLQDADRAHVGVDHHVDFEALVFAFEERFFVLVLAHVFERVALLRPNRNADPLITQQNNKEKVRNRIGTNMYNTTT